MRHGHGRCIVALAILLLAPAALAAIDPDAEIVTVRKDCDGADNCFETLSAALTWTWGTRNPTWNSKLLVDIGPGIWNERLECPEGRGYVTFRGAGRDATSIRGGANHIQAAQFADCDEIEVMSLTLENDEWGVEWKGGGSSTWTDVDVVALPGGDSTIAWLDDILEGQEDEIALHYFFGCRITAIGRRNNPYPATAFLAFASENWFFGGEISWEVTENGGAGAAVVIRAGGDVRTFGTAIRATAKAENLIGDIAGVDVSDAPVISQINAGQPATFHMHGGIVSVNANGEPLTGYGLKVFGDNALAHTPDTAFVVNTPGFALRVLAGGGARALSPFLHPQGAEPPGPGGFFSVHGADQFVETDCGSDGDCDEGGSEPHLMVFSTACATQWFDTVTGRCRNDTTP